MSWKEQFNSNNCGRLLCLLLLSPRSSVLWLRRFTRSHIKPHLELTKLSFPRCVCLTFTAEFFLFKSWWLAIISLFSCSSSWLVNYKQRNKALCIFYERFAWQSASNKFTAEELIYLGSWAHWGLNYVPFLFSI